MRPKKKLVIYSRDLMWREWIHFVIETQLSVNCLDAATSLEVASMMQSGEYDGIVLLGADAGMDEVFADVPDDFPAFIVLRNEEEIPVPRLRVCRWQNKRGDVDGFLTCVRMVLAKKRGPRNHQIEYMAGAAQ